MVATSPFTDLSVHAYIDPKNVASVRVAEHIGMHYEGRPTSTAIPPGSTNSCDCSSRGKLPVKRARPSLIRPLPTTEAMLLGAGRETTVSPVTFTLLAA